MILTQAKAKGEKLRKEQFKRKGLSQGQAQAKLTVPFPGSVYRVVRARVIRNEAKA